MKRLTKQWGDNPAVPTNISYDFLPGLDQKTADGVQAIVDRLAAYEDTGLEPEEIEGLLERGTPLEGGTAELLKDYLSIGSVEHLRALVQAEKDGRLAVLPCKVGDTVWANIAIVGDRYKSSDRPYPVEVVFIGLEERTGFFHGQYSNGRGYDKAGVIKIKPILFNTEMVQALLDDRKTATRRVVKPQPPDSDPHNSCFHYIENGIAHFGMRNRTPHLVKLPYRPGDILYVRETWQYAYNLDGNECPIDGTARYLYAADNEPEPFDYWLNPDGTHRDSMPWRPSIHMPREAARIFLRVTDVRVERVQDIAYADIIREGITEEDIDEREAINREASSKDLYSRLWNSTVKPAALPLYGWDANPWVWVISFERISEEEAYAHNAF